MKQNNTYVDIYSHSSSVSNRSLKSKGRVKSILCFLLLVAIIFSTFIFYFLGYAIGNVASNAADSNNNYVAKLTDDEDSTAFEAILKRTVGIYVYNSDKDAYASGVIISQDGYIVTSDHIFKGINSPKILVYDSADNYYNAAFIGGDYVSDIAVIKIEKTGLDYIDLNAEVTAKAGERVYSVGCPMDKSLSMSITSGIVSGTDRRIKTEEGNKSLKMIQTDAPINPGCSGGGLFDSNGNLIGINTSKIVDEAYEGVGFAIDVRTVAYVTDNIIRYGNIPTRASLGIGYESRDYTTALKDGKNCGIIINSIKLQSGLYGVGIKQGDVIISINGKKIYDESIFLDEIEGLKAGDNVKLVIVTADYNQLEVETKLISSAPKTNYIG